MEPLVSIVINNYNYARYLRAAIDSALSQRWAHTEVIVVDDGSTDGSGEVIGSYGTRIVPILKENGGQASAVNAGFQVSRGHLVIFLDADDTLHPDAAEQAAARWRPGVAKVQFSLSVIDGDGRPLGYRLPREPMPSGDLRERVLWTGIFPSPPTSGNAFARAVLELIMPVPEGDWTIGPDAYLLLLAPLLGEVVSIERPLGEYRSHGKNNWAMHTVTADRLREYLAYDARRIRMMHEMQPRFGFELPDGWLERGANHLQARLASLRLDPHGHPRREDRRTALALRGMAASRREPSFSPRKRILFAAWFLLVAALPASFARRLIELSYVHERRPSFLRGFLGGERTSPRAAAPEVSA